MGFRFRKSVKIAPGMRVNFSTRGASLSVGGRGGSVTVGRRGTYANVGIPGTGLSYRTRLDGSADHQRWAAQAQRRVEREQQRVERLRARQEALQRRQEALAKVNLRLLDNGAIEADDRFGQPLSQADWRLLWEQKSQVVHDWLHAQCEEINGDVELLTGIHLDTPPPDSEPTYEPRPFTEPEPIQPQAPKPLARPERCTPEPLGFFKRFSKRARAIHQARERQLEIEYQAALKAWTEAQQRALSDYEQALVNWQTAQQTWQQQQARFEVQERERAEHFAERIRTDPATMDEALTLALNTLSWPRETLVSYDIVDDGRAVWLDVDLPEIEDLPQRIATIAASGKKLNLKNKSQRQLRQEYATHVHGIALRLAGTVLATLPMAETVVVSGYSQRLDPATGVVKDDYLYSVRFTRKQFTEIDFDNLDRVDPVVAIEAFEHRRKMTKTGIFKPINPFVPGED